MTNNSYARHQQVLAAAWKQRTPTLPSAARAAAPWINQDGQPVSPTTNTTTSDDTPVVRGYAHCLPAHHAMRNLLPEAREAVELFADLKIAWHCGIDGGPGNNLLSSQVQCVNALMAMVHDPARIKRAFGDVVDIAEVLPIEDDRYLTFEYIGPVDYFNEGAGKPRVRGSRCTSVDAAFRYLTDLGTIELALVEWKYTEKYTRVRKPNPGYDKTRIGRYRDDYEHPDGPLRSDLLAIEWMLDEPLYQLMRQQLLAWRLEQDHAEGAETVRVLHVLPPANTDYQRSLVRPETKELGSSVDEVWSKLLRRPDRFVHIDPQVFCDEQVTSWDYTDRYSPDGAQKLPWGVSVWRQPSPYGGDPVVVAAAYVYAGGFEWCHRDPYPQAPADARELAGLPEREVLGVFDDEKTILVGPLEYARAFLRAVVTTGVSEPCDLVSYSWPDQVSRTVATWPPLDVAPRFDNR